MEDIDQPKPPGTAEKEVKFREKVQTHTLEMTGDFETDGLGARMSATSEEPLQKEDDDVSIEFKDTSRPATRSAGARIPSTTGQAARLIRTPLTSGRNTADTLCESYSSEDDDSSDKGSFLITEVKHGEQEGTLIPWDTLREQDRQNNAQEPTSDHDDDYDTDLEVDDPTPDHDPTGRTYYIDICQRLGVVPASYFARHITEPVITMRHHGLGAKGARAIAKCMKEIVTCEKLDLSANWMGEDGGKHMAKMVKDNDYISELGLADNFFGHEGAETFCKMLQENVTIRSLDLSGNAFTDNEALFFAEALEENKYLKHLNLSMNYFGDASGVILGPAIASNDICEYLDLSWNQIRGRGAVAVARGLKENIRIKECNLAWNGLGTIGGVAIADALTANEALTNLDISGNRIDSHATELIGKALAKNDLIKVLKIGNNPISTNSLVVFLNSILKSEVTVLEHLDVSDVPVEYEYLRTVIELKKVRPNFTEVHGPVMRSGNTNSDVGKPSIDPKILTNPLVVLREHIVINDVRILEILQKYDTDHSYSVTQDDFASALKDLGVPFDRKQLLDLSDRLGDENGKIFYGDILKKLEKSSNSNSNNAQTPGLPVET